MSKNRPKWDEERAGAMIGRRVLICLRYASEGDQLKQTFGTIVSIDPENGFEIRLEGTRAGEILRLPPLLEAFHPAPPGEYRLRSTQEVVTNPDFTSTWRLEKEPK